MSKKSSGRNNSNVEENIVTIIDQLSRRGALENLDTESMQQEGKIECELIQDHDGPSSLLFIGLCP